MIVDTRPRRKNAPRPASKSAPGFLQWLRGRHCACMKYNFDCGGRIQAAHVPDPATKGIGTKSADRYAIPLSARCHATQHLIGWPEFARVFLGNADPRALAEAYWARWPGRKAWEAKQ